MIVAFPGLFSYLFSYVLFVLSMFVPHLSFVWCLRKAVLRDYTFNYECCVYQCSNTNFYQKSNMCGTFGD